MKKILTFCLLLLILTPLFAQQLSVKSFRKLPNDLDARVNESRKDQNGDVCAIIKVVTNQTGFSFDSGQIGIVKTMQKPGEIWVYLPFGAKKLTISHPHLGILRDYQIPVAIEKAIVYELVLISGSVGVVVDETIVSQWLVITPQPSDAMIYLNEKFVKNGIYQAKLKPGKYSYRVESPKYHTEAGMLEITDGRKELSVTLKPAFGYLTLTSEPESGANVIIDGEKIEQVTPCEKMPLSSGEHTVQVIKDNFQPSAQKITVQDGKTVSLKLTLTPNFAEVVIQSLQNSEIFVDNESKGKGVWQGRIGSGVHALEARLERYRTAKKDIEVIAGENQKIELSPTPVYGTIDVITNPAGVTITINGKACGTSPITISNLLIGENKLRLSKQGFADISKTIVVKEGQTIELNESLVLAGQVNKNPPKAKAKPGKMPEISYGKEYYKYKKRKTIWLVSGLVTASVGTLCYLQAGNYYTQYQYATTDTDALQQKVKTLDTIYPICFVLAGASTVAFIIQAKKQGKAKKSSIGLYPQPVFHGAGLGLVYNF
jgi:hypothetical protein